ncbi:MAG: hypothetical protein EOP48_04370 [Sphingobacteriales bacterium]|nr:MAG: hypothetical protein EOP48_04370 [Sphingobacteriales bacterium]
MTNTIFIATLSVWLISSCKVTNKDLTGLYRLNRFPKTNLTINSDGTFDFSKINSNPYLHPFEHPEEYYADTKGTWRRVENRTISLTSQRDTLIYPLVAVEAQPSRDDNLSYFAFYDTYGDTVNVLYVEYVDGLIVSRLHGSMRYFVENLTKRDTFTFYFYGYPPFTFMSTQKLNQDYKIVLKPAFQPGYFQGDKFSIKRNKLIDIKRQARFIKPKGG